MRDFEGHQLQSIDKQGLELPGDDLQAIKKRQDKIQEDHKDLTDWMKELYGQKVCLAHDFFVLFLPANIGQRGQCQQQSPERSCYAC